MYHRSQDYVVYMIHVYVQKLKRQMTSNIYYISNYDNSTYMHTILSFTVESNCVYKLINGLGSPPYVNKTTLVLRGRLRLLQGYTNKVVLL